MKCVVSNLKSIRTKLFELEQFTDKTRFEWNYDDKISGRRFEDLSKMYIKNTQDLTQPFWPTSFNIPMIVPVEIEIRINSSKFGIYFLKIWHFSQFHINFDPYWDNYQQGSCKVFDPCSGSSVSQFFI